MYPAYIDQERTLKEGRRLSKENCTKNPDAYAIYYVCAVLLKLQVALNASAIRVRGGTMLDVEWAESKSTCRTRKGKRTKDPTSDIIFDSRKKLFARVQHLKDPETKFQKITPKEQEADKIALAEEEKLERATGGGGNRKKKKNKKKRR